MEINDSNFAGEVVDVSKEKPVVVDFWAPWCSPCMVLGPIMKKVAEEYSDKVKIVKLNVDENKKIASEYGIMSIPAVKMFKDGKVVSEFVGVRPEEAIKEWIDSNL